MQSTLGHVRFRIVVRYWNFTVSVQSAGEMASNDDPAAPTVDLVVTGIRGLFFGRRPDAAAEEAEQKAKKKAPGKAPPPDDSQKCTRPPSRLRVHLRAFGDELKSDWIPGAFDTDVSVRLVHRPTSLVALADLILTSGNSPITVDVLEERPGTDGDELLIGTASINSNDLLHGSGSEGGWTALKFADGVDRLETIIVEDPVGVTPPSLQTKTNLPPPELNATVTCSPSPLVDWPSSAVVSARLNSVTLPAGSFTITVTLDERSASIPVTSTGDGAPTAIAFTKRWFLAPRDVVAFRQRIIAGNAPSVTATLSPDGTTYTISTRTMLHPLEHLSTVVVAGDSAPDLDWLLEIDRPLGGSAIVQDPAPIGMQPSALPFWLSARARALRDVRAHLEQAVVSITEQQRRHQETFQDKSGIVDEIRTRLAGPLSRLAATMFPVDDAREENKVALTKVVESLLSEAIANVLSLEQDQDSGTAKYPSLRDNRLRLGRQAMRERSWNRAAALLEEVVSEGADGADQSRLLIDLAMCRLHQRDYDNASVLLDRAGVAADDVSAAAALEFKDYGRCRRILKRQSEPSSPVMQTLKILYEYNDQPHMVLARLRGQGHRPGAFPDEASFIATAQSLITWGLPLTATTLLSDLVASSASIAQLLKGQALSMLGDITEAIRVLESVPATLDTITALGHAYYEHGQPDAARFLYERCDTMEGGTDSLVHLRHGHLLYRLHRYEPALHMFQRVLEQHPDSVSAWLGCGQCYSRLGVEFAAKAEQCLSRATSMDPECGDAWGQLAMLYDDPQVKRPQQEVEATAAVALQHPFENVELHRKVVEIVRREGGGSQA